MRIFAWSLIVLAIVIAIGGWYTVMIENEISRKVSMDMCVRNMGRGCLDPRYASPWVPIIIGAMLIGLSSVLLAIRQPTSSSKRIPCPFCAEDIQPAAKLCPYCRSDVAGAISSAANAIRGPESRTSFRPAPAGLSTGHCPEWGTAVPENARVCPYCTTKTTRSR